MYKYLFGPVRSRRLGLSLGIDLLERKICSFNCVYCEVKRTEVLTLERKPYVTAKDVIYEIDLFFRANPDIQLNYITFSGQGEPTLNSEIARVIQHLKDYYSYPVCVLTNGSLLDRQEVRKDLLKADLIIPSLDAVSDKVFRQINHPVSSIKVESIVEGIKHLRQEFSGELWLEILFVEGINDTDEEISLLKEIVKEIHPDKVYVNTVYRPPAYEEYHPISHARLESVQSEFNSLLQDNKVERITLKPLLVTDSQHQDNLNDLVEQLKLMLQIRPGTMEDIYSSIHSYNNALEEEQLSEVLDDLVRQQVLKVKEFENAQFYYFQNS